MPPSLGMQAECAAVEEQGSQLVAVLEKIRVNTDFRAQRQGIPNIPKSERGGAFEENLVELEAPAPRGLTRPIQSRYSAAARSAPIDSANRVFTRPAAGYFSNTRSVGIAATLKSNL